MPRSATVPALTLALLLATAAAHADTTQTGPSTYEIDAGVTFNLGNTGASDYLFSWSDSSGSFSSIADPTIVITAGQTYNFRRVTGSHPFVITDNTLPVSGTDGSFIRTTFDGAAIDAATLTPIADFTADAAPTTDQISWTPSESDVGEYYYTCRITSHPGMTGRIVVVSGNPGCSPADLAAPFGAINFFDLLAYIDLFNSGDSGADLAPPSGTLNFFDLSAYLSSYNTGCP